MPVSAPWPQFDEALTVDDVLEIAVQVNGKVRSRVYAPFGSSKEELEKLAFADEKVQAQVAGKTLVKIVAVPDKLVNIVVK